MAKEKKFLYPIFKLPREYHDGIQVREIPKYIKWWLYNNYKKKHEGVISDILLGTNFTLTDSLNRLFNIFEVQGNTEQESYFGTNKLNINYLPISTNETTLNGGSYTFDETSGKLSINASNASGSVTVRSTYNASSNFVLKAGSYYSQVNLNTKKVSNGTGAQYAAGAITIAEDVYITQWYVPTSQGYTKEVYLQINNGSTALPYEKYVGGIPAPNSNYECPIYNVTGNVNNKIQNKNLFNKNTVTKGYCLLTDGTTSTLIGFITSDYIEIDSNTNYYLTNTGTKRFKYYDENKNAITNTWDLAIVGSQTFTTPATAKYIRLCVDIALISVDSVQLEHGSTATQYVEHQEQNLPFTLASGQKMYQGSYLADNGIHHKRKQVMFSGTTITLTDAKTNGAYVCNKKVAGNLSGQLLTFDEEVTNAIIEYELAIEEIIPYNVTQQAQYTVVLQAYTYADETNISSTSDGASPILKIQYWKKETENINPNIINAIKNSEEDEEDENINVDNEEIEEDIDYDEEDYNDFEESEVDDT